MENSEWLSAQDALSVLGVKAQTLYAYVSRGLIRAVADPSDSRKSQYSRHDISALSKKQKRPRRRTEIAASTISFGEPVLQSSISTIKDGALFFGETNASLFSNTATLEETAEHHWRTKLNIGIPAAAPIPIGQSAKIRGYNFLAAQAGTAPDSINRTRNALAIEAWQLLHGFTDAVLGLTRSGLLHERIGSAWQLDRDKTDIIRRALVLISDHELNASTFSVRVAASTGTSLAGAVLAGFATLNGPLHGKASTNAYKYLKAAMTADDLNTCLSEHTRMGGLGIGYGHTMYPDGDIRAKTIFCALELPEDIQLTISKTSTILGRKPNIDTALAALALTCDLKVDGPFCLFAIGRMAGWLAHAIEQIETGSLIRPRATYVKQT